MAVVTNAELDHHATYRSLRELEQAFAEFAAPARRGSPGPGVDLRPRATLTYGIGAGDLRAEDGRAAAARARASRSTACAVQLRGPGRATTCSTRCRAGRLPRGRGRSSAEAAPALAPSPAPGGASRTAARTAVGRRVYDDYAHHPTEVRATLEAARTLEPQRLVACFQPHLYSRTRELAREFGRALALADVVVVLDVYPARERAEDYPGVTGRWSPRRRPTPPAGRRSGGCRRMDDAEPAACAASCGEGDVLLTLGRRGRGRAGRRRCGERP